jgi:hypothetical protein
MRYIWGPLAAAFLLSACGLTDTGDRVCDFAATEGTRAYDEGLANAEFFICRAASVGSVQRRYGRSSETAEAWRVLCQGNSEAAVGIVTLNPETGLLEVGRLLERN